MTNGSTPNLDAYRGKLIRAQVETVGKDGLGHDLCDNTRYSKIKRLVEIIPDEYGVLYEES